MALGGSDRDDRDRIGYGVDQLFRTHGVSGRTTRQNETHIIKKVFFYHKDPHFSHNLINGNHDSLADGGGVHARRDVLEIGPSDFLLGHDHEHWIRVLRSRRGELGDILGVLVFVPLFEGDDFENNKKMTRW